MIYKMSKSITIPATMGYKAGDSIPVKLNDGKWMYFVVGETYTVEDSIYELFANALLAIPASGGRTENGTRPDWNETDPDKATYIENVPAALKALGTIADATVLKALAEASNPEVLNDIDIVANIAPLASDANAATIVTKVNALIAGLKTAKVMTADWTVTYVLDGCTATDQPVVAPNTTAFAATVTAAAEHTLPATIEVKVGGNVVAASGNYSYSSETGAIAIDADVITGDVVITVTATTT